MANFFLSLFAIWLSSINLYLFTYHLYEHDRIMAPTASRASFSFNFITFIVLTSIILQPFHFGLRHARSYFFRVLRGIFGTPFTRVTYEATFIANQATSLLACMPDISYTICFYLRSFITSSPSSLIQTEDTMEYCLNFNFLYISWWLYPLPNFWRFTQCLKRYWAGAGIRNLGNAFKYGNRLVVALFAGLYTHHFDNNSTHVVYYLWLTFSIINVIYSYYWDIVHDWGLMKFRRNSRHKLLRHHLMVPHHFIYYIAIVGNMIFRLISGFNLSPTVFFGPDADTSLVATFFYESESIRRSIWNFFRLENEHLNNVEKFRAVDLLPIPVGDQ
eukprot:TRINITY_DN3581_c0_g3_i3.p1 TRINITY_DN3581_c0_g3~~TRINITY_DN3581_c0_g3_i3.p1  ORF type:complete len:373 (-),score=41.53 TRINITY_DN3581_c0_g3_i3:59-1051(-)